MVMSSDTSEKSAKQEANTVILEFGGAKSDDIDDLRRGDGKMFRRIGKTIEELQKSGQVSDNIQPIIVILKKKKSKKGLLD